MSDAALVARARELYGTGEPGHETAKRCVALVYERHRSTVRATVAFKAPLEAVDDLEGDVYERFVRIVYLRRAPIESPGRAARDHGPPGRRHLLRPAQADA